MYIRKSYTKDIARNLRKNATPEERMVWTIVRNRKLSGLKFRRQHPIHPYVVDFYCAELNLVIELDGGHHQLPEQWAYDLEREEFLLSRGLKILRIKNEELKNKDVALLLLNRINTVDRTRT